MFSRRTCLQATFAAGCAALARTAHAAPEASPWRPLFNGRSLDGWSVFQQAGTAPDFHGAVAIEQGMLHLLGPRYQGSPQASFGHLATLANHADYHLRLDYRWGERRYAPRTWQRRNSGLLYHLSAERDRLFPDGVEFQIEEGDVGDAIMINTKALQGPLLGGTPLWPSYLPFLPRTYEAPVQAGGIARQWLRHAGQYEKLDGWNRLDLFAFGDQAAHIVNGRIVNTLFAMVDRNGAPLTRGRIALEFEAAEVFVRDVMIRDLAAAEIDGIKAGR